MAKKLKLSFPILEDKDNITAKKFGLVFTVPDELQQIYLSFGIDLERHNGNTAWQLPMPASYIINQDGVISYAEVSVDYTTRPEPEELLKRIGPMSD